MQNYSFLIAHPFGDFIAITCAESASSARESAKRQFGTAAIVTELDGATLASLTKRGGYAVITWSD